MMADDMIITAQSPVALQELIYSSEGYVQEFHILYNCNKILCIKFGPKLFSYFYDLSCPLSCKNNSEYSRSP